MVVSATDVCAGAVAVEVVEQQEGTAVMPMEVTTGLVLRYMAAHYRIEREDIRKIRPMVDQQAYAVETVDGRAFTVSVGELAAMFGGVVA